MKRLISQKAHLLQKLAPPLRTLPIVATLLRRSVLPVLAAGALLCASSSLAQVTYQIDDGTPEVALGINGGGDAIWLNQFSVTGGNNVVLSISVSFGVMFDPGNAILNGRPFTVYLWSDPNNDGNPTDAMVLASATGTVANAGTHSFVTVNIPPTAVMGSSFFVGVLMTHPSNTFPAALDETAPTFANRSWLAVSAAGAGNPHNLPSNGQFGTVESFNFSANWLVRANAIPEPSTYGLLAGGVALMGFVTRRRKRG